MTLNNLHPEYRRKINRREVKSFRDLEILGKELEADKLASKEYQPPPPKTQSVLPEYAFDPLKYGVKERQPKQVSATLAGMEEKPKQKDKWQKPSSPKKDCGTERKATSANKKYKNSGSKAEDTRVSVKGQKKQTKCFNCQGFGHWAKDCPTPKTKMQKAERRTPKKESIKCPERPPSGN